MMDSINYFDQLEAIVTSIQDNSDEPLMLYPAECSRIIEEIQKTTKELETRELSCKEDLKVVKDRLSVLEKERCNLKKETEKLRKEEEAIVKKIHKTQKEIQDSDFTISKLEGKNKISSKDEKTLCLHKLELSAYRKLSGIRWDFSVPNHILCGLCFNCVTNKTEVFEFDTRSHSSSNINKSLWNLIKKTATQDWDVNKEN